MQSAYKPINSMKIGIEKEKTMKVKEKQDKAQDKCSNT